jgi:hypothetical protein
MRKTIAGICVYSNNLYECYERLFTEMEKGALQDVKSASGRSKR